MNIENDVEKIIEKLKMKIIICGRKINKNIINLIISRKKFDFCSIDNNTNEEFVLSSLDKPKWDFYEFKDGFNEKIKEKIYEIIHKNFGAKGNDTESTLIFFTDEDEDDKDLLNFFDEKNNYFHPFIIFITNNLKKDKNYYTDYIRENELDFDDRNIQIIDVSDNNYPKIKEKIFKKLWKNCCYYNGIGDNIIIPEIGLMGAPKTSNAKFDNCINFFITGKPCSGKSRLVNIICDDKKAKERTGSSRISNNVVKYIVGNYPIALYDTPGFNSRNDIDLTIKNIDNKIKQITDDKDQIHGIFYVINSNSSRTLDEGEILLIKFILKNEIPLFFLLNYSNYIEIKNKKRNNYLESLVEVLENDFPKSNISKNIYQINLKYDYNGNIVFGLDKLFHDLYNFYFPHKINANALLYNSNNDLTNIINNIKHSLFFKNITELKDVLKKCNNQANKLIKYCCASSLLIGIIPIPFSDVYPLSSIELFLFTSILGIYGYNLNKAEILNILKSFGTSSVSAIVGYGLGTSLQFVPGIGIIGSIIKGSIATLTTYTIGQLCIKYCEENFEKTNALEFYQNLAFNYNSAVEDLKIIEENLSNKYSH